jgi:hypothetical protein
VADGRRPGACALPAPRCPRAYVRDKHNNVEAAALPLVSEGIATFENPEVTARTAWASAESADVDRLSADGGERSSRNSTKIAKIPRSRGDRRQRRRSPCPPSEAVCGPSSVRYRRQCAIPGDQHDDGIAVRVDSTVDR